MSLAKLKLWAEIWDRERTCFPGMNSREPCVPKCSTASASNTRSMYVWYDANACVGDADLDASVWLACG